jgi:transcriptional regulator with GAF, ATPase, and Fis domain
MLELLRIIDTYERLVQFLLTETVTEPVLGGGFNLPEYLDNIDERLVRKSLEGNRTQAEASKLLGINPRMMIYKIRKFKIDYVKRP